MNKAGGNTDNIIAIRQKLHTHPEGGFKEFRTSQAIIDALKSFGVKDEAIKKCAITGLVVDLQGKGPKAGKSEGINMIALRADMDGLPIPENATDLPYRTQTDHAHMCGHDGHMACLLSCAEVVQKNLDKIP